MDIGKIFRDAHKAIKNFSITSVWIVILVQLLLILIPIFESFVFKIQGLSTWIIILIIVFHAFVGITSLYALYKIKDLFKVIKIDEIEQTYLSERQRANESRETYTRNIAQLVAIQWSLSVLHTLLQSKDHNSPNTSDVEELLEPIVKGRFDALGFSSSDLFNLAVYKYNVRSKILQIYYRNCDDRIVTHNRKWRPGVGHVGITFSQNKTIISKDITQSAELVDIRVTPTDIKYYASFASTPILNIDPSAENPWGVLVITSSRMNHLNDEFRSFAENYALILSMYFSGCNIKNKGSK